MKTVVAVIVAGLLGGGAAIGAVAAGLVPVPAPEQAAKRAPVDPASEGPATTADHTGEIDGLKSKIKDLEFALEQSKSTVSAKDIEALKAEIDALKKQPVVAAKPAEAVAAPKDGPAPAEAGFEEAVRAVSAKMEAERVEQRRLDRQAARVTELEENKKRVAENVPKFVESQAQRLNLDATQVTTVSNALVAHLQARADLASERQGLRIDDKEVDEEAFDAREAALDETALNALTAAVPKETAENLLRTANRMGAGGQVRPNRGGGMGPGQGRGGNNN